MNKLNPKWEAFCRYYIGSEHGNATLAYSKAYYRDISKIKAYRIAQTGASRLLSNAIISKRISELLERQGLTDILVDAQLNFLIRQFGDLGVKMRAIQEYNKLKGRTNSRVNLNIETATFEQHIFQNSEARKITGYPGLSTV